ncbi:hypothetical protein ACFVIM_15610 [Streptomyces sp. NPDC057638]|uniref:hypothetical protein n=1 Tax=Streptomyces sp. NPDC057638 TaxID=3346190 RepID=UPI0036935FFC
MSGHALGYLCYVIAEGPVYGSGAIVPYVLATLTTASRETALDWLQHHARRVADLLDPDPAVCGWVTPAIRLDRIPVPDAPTEIRGWGRDPAERRAAWARLDQGVPVSVIIPDGPDRYTLAICPRSAPVAPGWATPPRGRSF